MEMENVLDPSLSSLSLESTSNQSPPPWLHSLVSTMDEIGASEWPEKYIAATSCLVAFFIAVVLGRKRNVQWEFFAHALVTGVGSAVCLYIDLFLAETISGTPEPLGMVRCRGPLTPLHRVLPAITFGFSIHDMMYGIRHGEKLFILHGGAMLTTFGSIIALGVSHAIVPMMIMEVSSIFLNLMRLDTESTLLKVLLQLCFAISFFVSRILFVPYFWFTALRNFRLEDGGIYEEGQRCFPHYLVYIVFWTGVLFHSLNLYWFVLIVKKIRRKLSGKESIHNIKKQ